MTEKLPLSQQIEEVERELKLRGAVYPRQVASGKMRQSVAEFHIARLQAALATLRWLAENEDKIRAKCDFADCRAEPQAAAPAHADGPIIKQRGKALVDMPKGGWLHIYDLLDGDKVIGALTVRAETRGTPPTRCYALGDQRFETAEAFVTAYRKTLSAEPAKV